MNDKLVVLRIRKGVPGIGRKLSRHYDANEVTCGFYPNRKVRDNAFVLNYGRSDWPVWAEDAMKRGVRFINTPDAVRNCVDKVATFRLLSTAGVECLDWTTDPNVANDYWLDEGDSVVIRSTAKGKQGKGIKVFSPDGKVRTDGVNFDDFDFSAPLYTKAYDKDVEFRIHVVNGEVVDYVQKKRMGKKKREAMGLDDVDHFVRNHKRGWVFAHNDVIRSPMVEKLALDTMKALGLDYGGVDILAKTNEDRTEVTHALVCECNSAPSMKSPTTFKAYTEAFDKLIGESNVSH